VHVDGLFRRASGVYVARLAVPDRHRSALGKHEFMASTGSHEIAIARIVAGELLSTWRWQGCLAFELGLAPSAGWGLARPELQ
jgi:hypothetical protein